ncbi:hypothetical protein [Amycolatopsis sp. 195334CR]|uniref:MmyB family transcriptional regulator n=1 Tax=Amycolatopsis sp. 195334CR TaxID=2814588 RepID=UPI001A8C1005|nr:hypothetical protein [Amycolatopsis sp. 195334CR]MBN6038462.1 hypothetical protein [Amycolatopsis sp. 195334CR]
MNTPLVQAGSRPSRFWRRKFPRSPEFYRDRGLVIRNNVALLRAAAGKTPNDEGLLALIGELSTKSTESREMRDRVGPKRYRHPLVGELDFTYESFAMPAYPA